MGRGIYGGASEWIYTQPKWDDLCSKTAGIRETQQAESPTEAREKISGDDSARREGANRCKGSSILLSARRSGQTWETSIPVDSHR